MCVCAYVSVFPTSSMMPQIELIVNVISSSDLLAACSPPLFTYQKPVCAKVAVSVFLLLLFFIFFTGATGATFLKIFFDCEGADEQ